MFEHKCIIYRLVSDFCQMVLKFLEFDQIISQYLFPWVAPFGRLWTEARMVRMVAAHHPSCRARPKAAPMVSLFFLVFLYIGATILVIRMVALAARMVSRYHPNHPSLSPRPDY